MLFILVRYSHVIHSPIAIVRSMRHSLGLCNSSMVKEANRHKWFLRSNWANWPIDTRKTKKQKFPKFVLLKHACYDAAIPRTGGATWRFAQAINTWRVFRRTMLRAILRRKLWNGNREKLWWHLFTKESLSLWVIQTHWKRQKSIPIAYLQPEYAHLRVYRFKSPRAPKYDCRRWYPAVCSIISTNLVTKD